LQVLLLKRTLSSLFIQANLTRLTTYSADCVCC